jgi:hypothetical protein
MVMVVNGHAKDGELISNEKSNTLLVNDGNYYEDLFQKI